MRNYTLDDMVAMATSRNVSYGRIQQCLEYGLKLPPLVRSTRWPKDSAHIGEEVLPEDVPETEEQVAPKKRPSKKKFGSGVLVRECDHCGKQILSTSSVRIFVHQPGDARVQGLKFADICTICANEVLPRTAPPKKRNENRCTILPGIKSRFVWLEDAPIVENCTTRGTVRKYTLQRTATGTRKFIPISAWGVCLDGKGGLNRDELEQQNKNNVPNRNGHRPVCGT